MLVVLSLMFRSAALVAPPAGPVASKPLVCGGKEVARVAAPKGDPETRRAAQRGLA